MKAGNHKICKIVYIRNYPHISLTYLHGDIPSEQNKKESGSVYFGIFDKIDISYPHPPPAFFTRVFRSLTLYCLYITPFAIQAQFLAGRLNLT